MSENYKTYLEAHALASLSRATQQKWGLPKPTGDQMQFLAAVAMGVFDSGNQPKSFDSFTTELNSMLKGLK